MSAELSVQQCKSVLNCLAVVKPVLRDKYIDCDSIAGCCGTGNKMYYKSTTFSGGRYILSGNLTEAPPITLGEGFLIPDKELNYLIEWKDT
jgi:hypothetical protein